MAGRVPRSMEVMQPAAQEVKPKKKAKKKKAKVTNNNTAKEENDESEERLVNGAAAVAIGDKITCKNTDDLSSLANHLDAIKLAEPKNGLVKLVNGEHTDGGGAENVTKTTEAATQGNGEKYTGTVKKPKKKHKNKKQKALDKETTIPEAGCSTSEESHTVVDSLGTSLGGTSQQQERQQQEPEQPKIVIEYKEYESELQMPDIMQLIQKDLSEPYSIYTYRYFIHNWPNLCFLAMHESKCVGAIVCKLDMHKSLKRGYIAMLAVDKDYRKMQIGTTLVQKAINVRQPLIAHPYLCPSFD